MTGAGAKALAALEEGGRARLQERLLFFPEGDEALARFREEFEAAPSASLADLCKRARLRPAALVAAFRVAAEAFDREVAKLKALQALPDVVDDLRRHALDRERKCEKCWGYKGKTGLGKTVVVVGEEERVCPQCDGNGSYVQASPFKEWASDRLTEIGKLRGEKGPLVAVQNNTANVSVGSGFMEQLLALSDKVLAPPTDIVDAEPAAIAAGSAVPDVQSSTD